MKPAFLITLDTEGDNLWGRQREITTRNTGYLPRFQGLCERFGFRPTWLTNHEMAVKAEPNNAQNKPPPMAVSATNTRQFFVPEASIVVVIATFFRKA